MIVDQVRVGRRYEVENQAIRAGAMPTFRLDGLVNLDDALDTALSFTPEGCRLSVTNRTDLGLENCLLVCNRYALRLGALPAGKTREIDLAAADVQDRDKYAAKSVERSLDQVRTGIITAIFKPDREIVVLPWRDRVHVVGWARGRPLPVKLSLEKERAIEKRPSTLVVQRIEPGRPGKGARVRILPPFFTLSAGGFRFSQQEGGTGVRMSGPGEFTLSLSPIDALRDVKLTRMELRANVSAWAYALTISARNVKTGKFEPLLEVRRPEGVQTAAVDDAARFYDPEDATIRIRLSLERIAETPKALKDTGVGATEWRLSDLSLDAEAEGL
jgi:hypothetical protein